MKKELMEGNVARVKDILENVHDDEAIIMIASVNKDGNPVLDTIEGKPEMSKDTVCMLISAAFASIRDGSGSDGDVTEGYLLEPVIPMAKKMQ
ncbi:MAG: hypothetical protein R3Y11_04995 [Pseudomonadota bacterium]